MLPIFSLLRYSPAQFIITLAVGGALEGRCAVARHASPLASPTPRPQPML